jgi:periplasmic protein TonB
MKNLILPIILTMFLTNKITGQTKTQTAVEQQAYYKNGGMEGFQKYISRNFTMPQSYKLVNAEGKMLVVFVVDSIGGNSVKYIHNALSFKGEEGEFTKSMFVSDCENEIKRVFAMMPKWIPGTQNGVPVRARFTFPLSIKTR